MIRLAVNADDFGFTRDVNDGIVEAHCHGILTSTTLMANGAAFEHAVKLAKANPTLDIGCHLTLVGGQALTGGALPASLPDLLRSLAFGRLRVYDEFAAQVRKILEAGLRPTHLDTHKHTHVVPVVLRAVARVALEFKIPWIRRPFDFTPVVRAGFSTRASALALRLQRARFTRTLAGCRTTDFFVGFTLTGRMGPAEMEQTIRHLPEGFTEFMCHPGFCGDELRRAPTRLKESRERELEGLLSPRVRNAVEERGIILSAFA